MTKAFSKSCAKWLITALILPSWALSESPIVATQDAPLPSPAGVVEIKLAAGPPCGSDSYEFQCFVLSIDGKKVATDHFGSVMSVLPNRSRPAVLGVTTSTGGAACCETSYLIDVSKRHASVSKGFFLTKEARIEGQDLIFDMVDGPTRPGFRLVDFPVPTRLRPQANANFVRRPVSEADPQFRTIRLRRHQQPGATKAADYSRRRHRVPAVPASTRKTTSLGLLSSTVVVPTRRPSDGAS